MNVKLISVTPDAEKTMAYVARVSNPSNQDNENYAGLLRYCIQHNHWSVFEQAHMTLEIETNRGIAAQILRHRSFTFQEFSQRYADTNLVGTEIPVPELRRQDTKNRQNSTDDLEEEKVFVMNKMIRDLFQGRTRHLQLSLGARCRQGVRSFRLTTSNPHSHLYDGFLPLLDTLYQPSLC
jgi:thymidylate synthase (FAD)